MKSYLRKLKAYVGSNPTIFDEDCPLPALDTLYWHYTEYNTITNEKTKQASRNLSAYLQFLPPKKRPKRRKKLPPYKRLKTFPLPKLKKKKKSSLCFR